jgi:hypothetical protein
VMINSIKDEIDLSFKDIYDEESHDSTFVMKNDETLLINRNGDAFISSLTGIEKFVLDVAVSNEMGFEKSYTNNGTKFKILSLGNAFKYINGFVAAYSQNYVYSDYVAVFFDVAKSLGLMSYTLHHPNFNVPRNEGDPILMEGDVFNSLISNIRDIVNSRRFKKKVASRNVNSTRNFISLCNYVDRLFDRYPKLLVLRIDLSYWNKSQGDPENHECALHDIPIERVVADRERFFNNIRRNKFGKDQVGYIWKLEYGYTKGHHIHLILFFDGSKKQKDAFLAQEIGEYWKNDITSGMGYCYNCNRDKSVYKKLGIGMINHYDNKLRDNLKIVLKYLTKKDQCLHRKLSVKCKVMGRGEMPQPKVSNVGRPRRLAS